MDEHVDDYHVEDDEGFDGQKGIAQLKIPVFLVNNERFLQWVSTSEHAIWFVMYSQTVNSPMSKGIDRELYENFFKEGKLVMSRTLMEIGNLSGFKSKASVSKSISRMLERGILKKHSINWNGRNRKVYELGYYSKGIYRHENLYMVEHFSSF